MNILIKQFIIVVGIILAILSIVFGSFLPLAKSQRYISALGSASSVKTLDEFKANFDRVFKFYSPVGDEETAKFLSSDILNSVVQKEQSEAVSRALISYIEPYMMKNNVRHLMVLGQMYSILWQKSGREDDFIKSEDYYRGALIIGPKLPPVLYSLFDLYQAKGDKEKAKEIGETILRYWPEEEKVRKAI